MQVILLLGNRAFKIFKICQLEEDLLLKSLDKRYDRDPGRTNKYR